MRLRFNHLKPCSSVEVGTFAALCIFSRAYMPTNLTTVIQSELLHDRCSPGHNTPNRKQPKYHQQQLILRAWLATWNCEAQTNSFISCPGHGHITEMEKQDTEWRNGRPTYHVIQPVWKVVTGFVRTVSLQRFFFPHNSTARSLAVKFQLCTLTPLFKWKWNRYDLN